MNRTIASTSSFLFSMPSFLSGMSRVLDLGNTFDVYNTSASEREADQIALSSDWAHVGTDLIDAMERFEDGE